MTNHEGVEIQVGEYIVSGEGEDADYGQVLEIESVDGFGAAGPAEVAWQSSGTRGSVRNGERCDVYTSREAAREAFEAAFAA